MSVPLPNPTSQPYAVPEIFKPASGFFLAAVFCLIAGLATAPHPDRLPPPAIYQLVAFCVFIIPVYISRIILYEQRNISARITNGPESISHLRQMSLAIVWTIFPCNTLWFVLALWYSATNWPEIIFSLLRVGFAIVPFYWLMVWATLNWPSQANRFSFRYRNFFPAVTTCLTSFVFGATVNSTDHRSTLTGLLPVVITVAMIIASWRLSLRRWGLFLAVSISIFTGAVFVYPFISPAISSNPAADLLRLLLFGLLMTFVMGIGEAWRVIGRLRDQEEFIPDSVPESERDLLGIKYVAGTNIAIALFLPLFFLTILHSTTTYWYLGFSFGMLLSQFILWTTFQHRGASRPWAALGIGYGLILPILIAVTTNRDHSHYSSISLLIGDSLGDTVTIIGVMIVVLGFLEYEFQVARVLAPVVPFQSFPWTLFSQPSRGVALASYISAILSILVSLALFIQRPFGLDATSVNRLKILLALYILLAFALGVPTYFIRLIQRERTRSTPSTDSNAPGLDPEKAKSTAKAVVKTASLLISSGRPITSGIAFVVAVLGAWSTIGVDIVSLILRCLPLFLLTAAGFVLNDVFDREKDRDARVRRPIATGELRASIAAYFGGALILAAVSWELFYGVSASLLVVAATGLGVVAYSPSARLFPLAKGLFTAFLSCAPLLYATSLSARLPNAWCLLVCCGYVIGRELLLDAKDLDGDRRAGIKTLASLLGPRHSYLVAFLVMFLAASFGMWLAADAPSRILIIFSMACLLFTLVYSNGEAMRAIPGTRLALLLGGTALALNLAI